MSLVNQSKCRACLDENPTHLFSWRTQIENVFCKNITYLECFQICTRLEADANDQLPQSLCFQCASQVRDAYEFIKRATLSHQMLLMEQESLFSKAEPTGFEWVAVEKTDADEENHKNATSDINLKTLPADNLANALIALSYNQHSEIVENINIKPMNVIDASNDRNGDCFKSNSTPQRNDEDEIIFKSTNDTIQVATGSNIKLVVKKKRIKRKLDNKKKAEKVEVQEGQHKNNQANINCEFCKKLFARNSIKRHIKRVHNVRMILCHKCPRTFRDVSKLAEHALTHDENRKRNFSCDQCDRKFFTSAAYKTHSKTHETNRKAEYQCVQCDKQFFHKGSLKLHMLMHTGETLECKICQKRYPRKIDLIIHMRVHSGDMPYKCRYCERAFSRVGHLNKHERHHEGFRYKCEFCDKEYLNQNSLIKHRKGHTGMPLKCLICNKGFVTKSNIKRHIEGVHKTKDPNEIEEYILKVQSKKEYRGRVPMVLTSKYSKGILDEHISSKINETTPLDVTNSTDTHNFNCTACQKEFKTRNTLKSHMGRQHKIVYAQTLDKLTKDVAVGGEKTTIKNIKCSVCKRMFTAAKYAAHFSKVHKKSPDGYQCPKCTKQFAYQHQLKSHFEVHHGLRQKNVPCSICSKMFYTKKLLNTHMITHQTNEINFKCELCGKGFQRNASLRRHMIMHQGGREQCSECSKRFPNITELRIHTLIHTKENPFLCNICGKSFRRKGPLSYHMRKHRGEKYACEHCGQEFSCQSSMRRHEYKHIGFPFKCPRCDAGQVTRGSLQRHLKEEHRSELTAIELRELYNTVQNTRLQ